MKGTRRHIPAAGTRGATISQGCLHIALLVKASRRPPRDPSYHRAGTGLPPETVPNPGGRSGLHLTTARPTEASFPILLLRFFHAFDTMVNHKVSIVKLDRMNMDGAARIGVEAAFR